MNPTYTPEIKGKVKPPTKKKSTTMLSFISLVHGSRSHYGRGFSRAIRTCRRPDVHVFTPSPWRTRSSALCLSLISIELDGHSLPAVLGANQAFKHYRHSSAPPCIALRDKAERRGEGTRLVARLWRSHDQLVIRQSRWL